MKKALIIILALTSCNIPEPEQRWFEYSVNNLRIDDDAEYHFTATNPRTGHVFSERDKNEYRINIYRRDVSKPIYRKLLENHGNSWIQTHETPQLIIPLDYKIETFDD